MFIPNTYAMNIPPIRKHSKLRYQSPKKHYITVALDFIHQKAEQGDPTAKYLLQCFKSIQTSNLYYPENFNIASIHLLQRLDIIAPDQQRIEQSILQIIAQYKALK